MPQVLPIDFKLQKGLALDAQQGFTDAFNLIVTILNNLGGKGSIGVEKGTDGLWYITLRNSQEGLPAGYEEKEMKLWTEDGLISGTFLVKNYEVEIEPTEYNNRRVLQSDGEKIVISSVKTITETT